MTRVASLLSALFVLLLGIGQGQAQVLPGSGGDRLGTFITPFPENDVYRIQVYGDGLADGLADGLNDALGKEAGVALARRPQAIGGLLRGDPRDELRVLERELQKNAPHIALIMPSMVLRLPWREGFDRRFPPNSMARQEEIERRRDAWKAQRGLYIDHVTRMLRRRNVAVYWVGLPIMRHPLTADDAQIINAMVRERAILNGGKYIDTYTLFADAAGAYSSYGPDLDGKARQMREQDGIHLSWYGNRKLGHFVERALKRDMSLARAEREIPLAGAEPEQRRLRQSVQARSVAGRSGSAPGGRAGGASGGAAKGPGSASAKSRDGSPVVTEGAGLGANNSRITLNSLTLQGKEERLVIEIVRPAIPGPVLAAVTRRQSPDKLVRLGDPVATKLPGGGVVVSTVAPVVDANSAGRRAVGVNAPYHLVLEKGQRLPPRPGRLDDLPWPRPENAGTETNGSVPPAGPQGGRDADAGSRR